MTPTGLEMPSQRDLPGEVSIARLVAAEAELDGRLAIKQLGRLADLLANDEGIADVELQFLKDDEGRKLVKGCVSTAVDVFCQRCLEPMTLALQQDFALALVAGEEPAKHLPDELEPLIVEDDIVDLHALVEDELLLALPIVSLHEQSCGAQRYMSAEEPTEELRQKPFEDLAQMLGKN